MKVWAPTFNIFAVLLMLMLTTAYHNITRAVDRDFDQIRLNHAVRYATEAAFLEAIRVDDIGIGYDNLELVSVSPGKSLDTFINMLAINYDMSLSEENKQFIQNSIASIVLTGNYGFYITQLVENDTTPGNNVRGGEFEIRWSPKIPYFMTIGNTTYALNLNKERWVSVSDALTIRVPNDIGYPAGITRENVLEAVNNQITDTMIQEIERKNSNNQRFDFRFFLPVETTRAGVNPIQGPGILVFMQSAKFASSERINAVSVAGFRATRRINIIAFTENIGGVNRKFYSLEGQMDPIDIGTRYRIENFFRNTREAALAGYAPHFGLLTRKSTVR